MQFILKYRFKGNKRILENYERYFTEDIDQDDLAEYLSIDSQRVNYFFRENKSSLRIHLGDYKDDIETKILTHFQTYPVIPSTSNTPPDILKALKIYGWLKRNDIPVPRNIHLPASIQRKHNKIFKKLKKACDLNKFIPIEEVKVIREFIVLLGCPNSFMIVAIEGKNYLAKYSEQTLTELVFRIAGKAVTYEEYVVLRSQILWGSDNDFYRSKVPADLTVFPFVYLFGDCQFVMDEYLSIKDHLDTIIEKTTELIGCPRRNVELPCLFAELKPSFPLNFERELFSILSKSGKFIINGSNVRLKASYRKKEMFSSEWIKAQIIDTLNSPEFFPFTSVKTILEIFNIVKKECVMEILSDSDFTQVPDDKGEMFLLYGRWKKTKMMYCVVKNLQPRVPVNRMKEIILSTGKKLSGSDCCKSFQFKNEILTCRDGFFSAAHLK